MEKILALWLLAFVINMGFDLVLLWLVFSFVKGLTINRDYEIEQEEDDGKGKIGFQV